MPPPLGFGKSKPRIFVAMQPSTVGFFIVESFTRLAELRATPGQFAVSLDLDSELGLPAGVMQDIRAVAVAHPGSAPLELRWRGPDGSPARLRSSSLKLSTTGSALLELRSLLGAERVRLVRGS